MLLKQLLRNVYIMMTSNKKKPEEDCRNCSYKVIKGIRRCPYCGIMNPALKLKEVFFTIIVVLGVMSVVAYLK